jgi:hypothetical protein
VTVCGLFSPLSLTVTVPVGVPPVVGVKVTDIVQLEFTATLEPQVLVSAKGPVALTLLIVSAAVPVLVSVTTWAGLVVLINCVGKVRLVGERVATPCIPTPVRVAIWGVPIALSAMLRVPGSVPLEAGEKVTLMLQPAPAVRVDPHRLVTL